MLRAGPQGDHEEAAAGVLQCQPPSQARAPDLLSGRRVRGSGTFKTLLAKRGTAGGIEKAGAGNLPLFAGARVLLMQTHVEKLGALQ